jgi:hypothetical protein
LVKETMPQAVSLPPNDLAGALTGDDPVVVAAVVPPDAALVPLAGAVVPLAGAVVPLAGAVVLLAAPPAAAFGVSVAELPPQAANSAPMVAVAAAAAAPFKNDRRVVKRLCSTMPLLLLHRRYPPARSRTKANH